MKKTAANTRAPAKKSALSLKALREHLLKDGPEAILGIDFVPPREKPFYDLAERRTPVIARRWGSEGWVYETPSENRFCLYASMVGFNQVAFDTFIEEQRWDSPVAKENLQWALTLRTKAFVAFKAKNYPLMQAIFETLNLYRQFLEEDDKLRNLAVTGAKFIKGRKPGTSGPVRKAVATVLKTNLKLTAEEVWQKLKSGSSKRMSFNGEGANRHIWTEGHGVTSWPWFQTIVSQERAKLRG